MKTRDVLLVNAESIADAGSKTYPLNQLGKIQYLRLIFKATNGATSNTVGKLKSLVSKIEITDGSDALHSVSGREEFALNCYHNLRAPYQDLSGGAAVVITDEVIVEFGRWQGDREYYLDMASHRNAQLKVTWAYTVSATAGIATATGSLTVIARVIEDGAPPYKGFITRKEIGSWTTVASGDQTYILPLDYPYVGLLISALKTTVDPSTIITNFKLSRDTDRYVDFNISGAQMYSYAVEMFGRFLQKFRPLTDTAATWLSDLYYQTGAWFSRPGATAKSVTTAVAAESVTTAATTGGTADATELEVEGGGPGAAAYWPFGTEGNPDDFLNPAGLGELKLILSQGVASGAGTVVIEQVRQ